MKKFNLFKEIIIVDKSSMINAMNSSKEFGISALGEIKYAPFEENQLLIYKGKHTPAPTSALKPAVTPSLSAMLGKNYQLVEDDDRLLIKAFSNWQELIGVNMPRSSYDDTTADGVAEFSHKALEDIGWHVTEFNVKYRELVEVLEENCEGTMICIEQEEPYQFSGLGFLHDNDHATQVLFEYCQKHVKNLVENDEDFAKDELDDDQLEALAFFKLS